MYKWQLIKIENKYKWIIKKKKKKWLFIKKKLKNNFNIVSEADSNWCYQFGSCTFHLHADLILNKLLFILLLERESMMHGEQADNKMAAVEKQTDFCNQKFIKPRDI